MATNNIARSEASPFLVRRARRALGMPGFAALVTSVDTQVSRRWAMRRWSVSPFTTRSAWIRTARSLLGTRVSNAPLLALLRPVLAVSSESESVSNESSWLPPDNPARAQPAVSWSTADSLTSIDCSDAGSAESVGLAGLRASPRAPPANCCR